MSEVNASVSALAETDVAPVTEPCEFLDVSRSALCAWRDRGPTIRERQNDFLKPLVRIGVPPPCVEEL